MLEVIDCHSMLLHSLHIIYSGKLRQVQNWVVLPCIRSWSALMLSVLVFFNGSIVGSSMHDHSHKCNSRIDFVNWTSYSSSHDQACEEIRAELNDGHLTWWWCGTCKNICVWLWRTSHMGWHIMALHPSIQLLELAPKPAIAMTLPISIIVA